MYTKRLKFFLFQLLGFFPLSIIINALAVLPILVLLGFMELAEKGISEKDIFVVVITFVVSWGIAFLANKLRMNMRGRWTTRSEEMEVVEGEYIIDKFGDWREIDRKHYRARVFHDTWYAVIATLLSFIALPLGFVALVMSALALFYPRIFSTPCRVEEERFSRGNIILHMLFDFVILPSKRKKQPKTPNLLGLLGILEAPLILVLGLAVALGVAKLLVSCGVEVRYDLAIGVILISQLFILFDALIIVLVSIIDTVCLTLDFSPRHIGKIIIRIITLGIAISLPMLGITMLWGQLGTLSMSWEELIDTLELFFELFS